MKAVRVVTYNLLSSSLCEPTYFVKNRPEDLNPLNRLDKIEKLLDAELSPSTVVCLQEVSRDWAGKLHVFFAARDYQFATSLYGHRFNGYMGVGLAWPTSLKLKRLQAQRLSDLVREKPREPSVWSRIQALWKQPEYDVWFEALKRSNTLLCADFGNFCVACYHMPCVFGSVEKERLMTIHATLAANTLHQFANGAPYVLAGDFNIKPPDASYHLLTTGALGDHFQEYTPPTNPRLFKPFDVALHPLVSAYSAKLGVEPDFTNFAFTKNNKESFIATLDYIFCSSDAWTVDDVKPLPRKADVDLDKPYPDALQPSDHIMLAADLSLTTTSS